MLETPVSHEGARSRPAQLPEIWHLRDRSFVAGLFVYNPPHGLGKEGRMRPARKRFTPRPTTKLKVSFYRWNREMDSVTVLDGERALKVAKAMLAGLDILWGGDRLTVEEA
jgi:hypothetical protein